MSRTPDRSSRHGEPAATRIQRLLDTQRAAFQTHPFPPAGVRIAKIRALRRQIGRHQEKLIDAIGRDFGFRSPDETRMLDLMASVLHARHATSHVRRWMRPARRRTELLFLGNGLQVTYQPKGVVGIIVPWNFPVYLALGPLIVALAAGNRVMLKMPAITPATNAALEALLGEIFDEDEVALIGEELDEPALFAGLPFDHLVFTGSTATGRSVMLAAAANLTPVTLELGGKSPALVCRDFPLEQAALRIVHGKAANCGQICVSPDYALVPQERLDEFVTLARDAFLRLYGDRLEGDYSWVVDERHFARIQSLLDDARAKGAHVLVCTGAGSARDRRQMPLHIVTGCTPDMRILQEELFGPILPVVPYDRLDEALRHINAMPRPLALYSFGFDAAERDEILRRTHSGGVTLNDWGWHVINHDAPFGGSGDSGMGSYHGEEGFRELSHARTIFRRNRFFPGHLFYPPYGKWWQRLVFRLFLGKPGSPKQD